MSNAYLRQVSATYWQITVGRKALGFVRECPKGYIGVYRVQGQTQPLKAVAADPDTAFRQVMAKRNEWFAKSKGFSGTAELERHNDQVRHEQTVRRREQELRLRNAKDGLDRYFANGDRDGLATFANALLEAAKRG